MAQIVTNKSVKALEEGSAINNSQSCSFKGLYTTKTGKRLRVSIHYDSSYHDQSRSSVSVWSEQTMSWNKVDHIHYKNLDLVVRKVYSPESKAEDFRADANRLIASALSIVGD